MGTPATTVDDAVLRPESRGQVKLASADPSAAPRIQQRFLASGKDWQTLRKAIRVAREVSKQAPLERFIAAELGGNKQTDAELDAHVRATSITVHHPLGTCRMGDVSTKS